MAIKSKGRTRGRRTISAAPRRPLVVRKPPLWRRPWLYVIVGVLAAGGIVFGLLSAKHSRDVKARDRREAAAVDRFFLQFRAAMPEDRQAVPPDVLVIFPSVGTDLSKVGKELKGKALTDRGKEITAAAKDSVDKLQAIKVDQIIPSAFPSDRATIKDSVFLISRAIDLYRQVGGIVEASADVPAASQKALVDQATALTQQAGTMFDEGYRKLLDIGNRLGVAPNVPNPPPPTLPSPTPTASAEPSSTPSESPAASPTASASPTG